MKILEVIQSLAPGGAERLVVDLCNEMSITQNVTLLILKDAENFYLPQVSERVEIIQTKMKPGASIKQEFEMIGIINSINPDVVHFHSQARYTILLANILLGRKYKFFMTVHNDVYSGYKGGITGLQVKLSGFFGHTKFITISETNYHQFEDVYPRFREILIPNGRALPELSEKYAEVQREVASLKKMMIQLCFYMWQDVNLKKIKNCL